MRRLLFFIVITAMGMFKGHSQALVQTYTDRCTGVTSVFTVPMNGSTVVAYYNRSKTFTSQDFQNGTLQAWLEETYLWWTSLSPCSTTTAGTTATQQTTQQTTQQATQAATNAAAATASNPTTNAPPTTTSPPATSQTSTPPPADTNTANTTAGTEGTASTGADTSSTGGNTTSSGGSETSTSETQSGSSEGNSSSTETSESSNSSGESSESTSESKTEETKTEEKTEEVKEEKKEETKEESKEESKDEKESDESTEEDSEEKKDEEESESDEDEKDKDDDSEEESDDEGKEEGDKKKKKRRNLSPPVVMANMLSQQGPDGRYTQAAMFGVSQSSLLGTETYGLNAMVYSNLQQFMLTANYSKVHIKVPNVSELNHDTHKHYGVDGEVDSDDPQTSPQPRVNRVYSGSIGMMKMYSTYVAMMNHSMVWLGEKGTVAGLAFGTSLTSVELDVRKGLIYYDTQILGTSLTGFATKPFNFDRLTVSPMLAISSPFMNYDMFYHDLTWNKDIMVIGGSSFTYSLTQRFGLNFGINIIESTIKDFPTLKTFTIGGRLSF